MHSRSFLPSQLDFSIFVTMLHKFSSHADKGFPVGVPVSALVRDGCREIAVKRAGNHKIKKGPRARSPDGSIENYQSVGPGSWSLF